jgi:hypothetical protein
MLPFGDIWGRIGPEVGLGRAPDRPASSDLYLVKPRAAFGKNSYPHGRKRRVLARVQQVLNAPI